MRRRDFIAALGGAAATPITAVGQTRPKPIVGFMSSLSEAASGHSPGLREGLSDTGYVEGTNVTVEYRWADGIYDRLPKFAGTFIRQRVAVIIAGALPAALAAKASTGTIPIVFISGADPVKFGLVATFSSPGGNATGVFQYFGPLGGKRLELLREVLPNLTKVGVLSNPNNANAEEHLRDISQAAGLMGLSTEMIIARTEQEIPPAFAAARNDAEAVVVMDDPLFSTYRSTLVGVAARHALPTVYYSRQFVEAGGLMSYGSRPRDIYRQAGVYVGRILNGASPADLPVLQPTAFELTINVKVAWALNLQIPPSLLARADEVIE